MTGSTPKREKAREMKRQKGYQAKREANPRSVKEAKEFGRCGAKTFGTGKPCGNKAGARTSHQGFGRCWLHGGTSPMHNMPHTKNDAILMGAPKDINPLDALLWCIKITAGEVDFCSAQIATLKKDEWTEKTIVGTQINMWAKERQKSMDRLARYSKDALALGLAERAVRLAEQYGNMIARYTNGIISDLTPFLSPLGISEAPKIIRKHLVLLDGGAPLPTVEERKRMPELPRRVT